MELILEREPKPVEFYFDTPGLARKNAANCLISGFASSLGPPEGAIGSPCHFWFFDDLKDCVLQVCDALFHKKELCGNQVLETAIPG
ncbi:MAG: hypothetical protein LAO21_08410 [Acidobacteriia bacterium]|nr:hypothetical protein [Terriglobia bacterium]